MATTPCPRCRTELGERISGRAKLLACRDCGGVWLDRESARKVLEHAEGALTQIVLSERVAASARIDVDREKTILCPFDAEPLTRSVAEGAEIDTCPIHGTWFDAGEVRRIANAFTKASEPSSSVPRRDSSPPDRDYVSAFLGALFATIDEID